MGFPCVQQWCKPAAWKGVEELQEPQQLGQRGLGDADTPGSGHWGWRMTQTWTLGATLTSQEEVYH